MKRKKIGLFVLLSVILFGYAGTGSCCLQYAAGYL